VGEDADASAGDDVQRRTGHYIRGGFGVRLEDDMHVTDNGAELFTPQSRSIEQPF
jgi:Xaa-Pro dipeptidase